MPTGRGNTESRVFFFKKRVTEKSNKLYVVAKLCDMTLRKEKRENSHSAFRENLYGRCNIVYLHLYVQFHWSFLVFQPINVLVLFYIQRYVSGNFTLYFCNFTGSCLDAFSTHFINFWINFG